MSLSKNSMILIAVIVAIVITGAVGAYTSISGLPDDGVFHDNEAIMQGEGSGLDADTLDNYDSSDFVRISPGTPSMPVLMASGSVSAEESITTFINEGDHIDVDHELDSDHNDQRISAVPGAFPDRLYEGELRLLVNVWTDQHFCYSNHQDHSIDGGGRTGDRTCRVVEWDKTSWVVRDTTQDNHFWVSTRSLSGTWTARGCVMDGVGGTEVDDPYADANGGLACYIDLDEPIDGIEVHTIDWSTGGINDYGQWQYDIHWQYMP